MDRYELELTYYEFGNLKFKLLESNIEYSIKRQTHDFNGYFFRDNNQSSLEDIQELENKLIDFLNENGYYFAGTSDIEADDEE